MIDPVFSAILVGVADGRANAGYLVLFLPEIAGGTGPVPGPG